MKALTLSFGPCKHQAYTEEDLAGIDSYDECDPEEILVVGDHAGYPVAVFLDWFYDECQFGEVKCYLAMIVLHNEPVEEFSESWDGLQTSYDPENAWRPLLDAKAVLDEVERLNSLPVETRTRLGGSHG